MRNDTQIKVTCITNDNKKDELHFDYYDKEGTIVGTVAVDEQGRLAWSIWNNEYQENILYCVSCVFGMKVENTMPYISEAKKADSIRWDRAQEYISSKGLYVNYLQNSYFNEEFNDSYGK